MLLFAVAGCNENAPQAGGDRTDLGNASVVDLSIDDSWAGDLAPTLDLSASDLRSPIDMANASPCGNASGLQANAPWPMTRGCPTHQARSPYLGAQVPKLKWQAMTGAAVVSSVAIGGDGTIYFGSADHRVYAVDGATGKQKWSFATNDVVDSSPAIGADGTVYIGSQDASVYAIDGGTGKQKWAFSTGASVRSSPSVGVDGTVYIGSYDKNVYALDGATGTEKWAFESGQVARSSPAIGADGTVYIGSVDDAGGKFYALDGVTG